MTSCRHAVMQSWRPAARMAAGFSRALGNVGATLGKRAPCQHASLLACSSVATRALHRGCVSHVFVAPKQPGPRVCAHVCCAAAVQQASHVARDTVRLHGVLLI